MISMKKTTVLTFAFVAGLSFSARADEDAIMGRLKPGNSTSADEARVMCKQLARSSQARGVRQLIISFEGLASFDRSGAESVYRYQQDLVKNGKADEEEIRRGAGGFLLHGLVVPALMRHGREVEVISLANDAVTDGLESAASVCAEIWKNTQRNNRLIVVGHSYGGHAAYQLSEVLKEKGVKVDLVITVDARTKIMNVVNWSKPTNVRRWYNYFRKGFVLPGYAIEGADRNLDLTGTGFAHLTIPTAPQPAEALEGYLAAKPATATE